MPQNPFDRHTYIVIASSNNRDCMHIRLNAGMAAQYFITDAEKSVSRVQDPAVLITRSPLDTATLAGFMAFLHSEQPVNAGVYSRDKLPLPVRPFDRAMTMIRKITSEHAWPSPVESVNITVPMVILAASFREEPLAALSVIKLRGYVLTLCVDVTPVLNEIAGLTASLLKDTADQKNIFRTDNLGCTGIPQLNGLTVLSGLKATVISTEAPADEIIKSNPDLISAP